MKGKKWVSLFLAGVLMMTVVENTGNMVFASESLEEEAEEETEVAADAPLNIGQEEDFEEGTENVKEPEAPEQEILDGSRLESVNRAEEIEIEAKANVDNYVADGLDGEEVQQKTESVEGDLTENEDAEAENGQSADEMKENLDRVALERSEGIKNEEDTAEEVVPQAGDIASGSSGNVSWVIDGDGKLTVSGISEVDGEGGYLLPGEEYREQITSIDLSNLDTSNVTNMNSMFSGYSSLKSLNLSGLDTSNVWNMSNMFIGCSNLESLDLSGLDTSNVTEMYGMFQQCSSLKSLDLSGLDTSNVFAMSHMFSGCNNLESLDLNGLDTGNVTGMYGMFTECSNLKSLDLSGLDTSKVTDMGRMFNQCTNLESLDLSGLDTSKVTDMRDMFSQCTNLKSLDLSELDTSNVTHMGWMFEGCVNIASLDLSNFNTSNVTDMSLMFSGNKNLVNLDVSSFDTSSVVNMAGMFSSCSNLDSLDLNNFNTSNVSSMEQMFCGCINLTSIDVSSFNTNSVTNMAGMFVGCTNLEGLDLSELDTSNVTNMGSMFGSCENITSLDLSNFNTSNVTDMGWMFGGNLNLINLDVSSFDTSSVVNMNGMFLDCANLTSIDLSNFDVSKVSDMSFIFSECSNLNTIYTPYNVKAFQYTLPLQEGYTWYLPDGTEITEIPANLDHSVMIVRRKNPKIITTTTDLNMEDVVRVKYVPYSYTVETNNTESDNIVTYSLVEGRLAEGLSLYPATGEIYGVPLETGSFPIRVKAEFSNPEYFPSYADLVLTVIENTDSNVFDTSDPGYELETPVGERRSGEGFVLTQMEDQLFVSAGAYGEFMDLWLNGQKLIEGEDYTKESGSTRITIRSQTFLNKADKEGVNTLAAEFREGGLFTNPLRRTAQNFRLQIQQNNGSSEGGYTGGGDSQSNEGAIRTATFAIRLVDVTGNALGGYTVELHSTPKVTRTNQKGIAVFRNVEEGPHTLYVKDAKGNILASKVFTLGIGGGLSLDGDQITAKDGAAFTLQLQMTGSTLTFLQVQEGDVYRVIPAQTGDESNPELWLALLALLGAAALAGELYRKRRNYA